VGGLELKTSVKKKKKEEEEGEKKNTTFEQIFLLVGSLQHFK
jgi:hypothetical protein